MNDSESGENKDRIRGKPGAKHAITRLVFREKLSAYFPQDRKILGKIRALRRSSTPHLEGIHNPEFAKRMPHSCGDVQSSNLARAELERVADRYGPDRGRGRDSG